MSSSLAERQKFLEHKFKGNRRLAEEFIYIQDPRVRQLGRWQQWKKQAEDESRWTSWMTAGEGRPPIEQEKYKDPFHPRRKRRHRHRLHHGTEYDVDREVLRIERRERSDWQIQVTAIHNTSSSLSAEPQVNRALPPRPPRLLAFATLEPQRKVPRHFLEPKVGAYFPPGAGGALLALKQRRKKKRVAAPRAGFAPSSDPQVEAELERSAAQRAAARKAKIKAKIKPGGGIARAGSGSDDEEDEEEVDEEAQAVRRAARASAVMEKRRLMREAAARDTWGPAYYRFKVWWYGYMAARNIQRVSRGRQARKWVSFRVTEPRALERRWACQAIQRVYRGHLGRTQHETVLALRSTAAVFIQRAARRHSRLREEATEASRFASAHHLQRALVRFNGNLIFARIHDIVLNKREADALLDGKKAMYAASLRMQIMMRMWLARRNFRWAKTAEKKAVVLIQAQIRGFLVRCQIGGHVEAAMVRLKEQRETAKIAMCSGLRVYLARQRRRKLILRRSRAATCVQRFTRGWIARRMDTRLRDQSTKAMQWLRDFKSERVGALTDSSEYDSFFLHVDPQRQPPKRAPKHKKSSLADLPRSVLMGPLWDDDLGVPDYPARAASDAARALLETQAGSNSPRMRPGNRTAASGGGGWSLVQRRMTTIQGSSPRKRIVGATIEPTPQSHIEMYRNAPSQRLAPPLGAHDLAGEAVDALDRALRARRRTVSRGLGASHGLPHEFDGETSDPLSRPGALGFNGQPQAAGLVGTGYSLDGPGPGAGPGAGPGNTASGGAPGRGKRPRGPKYDAGVPRPPAPEGPFGGGGGGEEEEEESEAFVEAERPEFGPRAETLDQGLCRFKGNASAKGLDSLSRMLVEAPHRDAARGLAPNANQRRTYRSDGSKKIMEAALDMAMQENRERGYL